VLRNTWEFKGVGRIRQKLVPPLVVERLADLMLGANLGHGFTFEALKHDQRFRFSLPLPSVHG
jgi:hypothetical protein